jgi:branched-chain amino acid transport system ATP-binding protein
MSIKCTVTEMEMAALDPGMGIILVEQNVREALKVSDRVVTMKAGQIILETAPEHLSDNSRWMELY